MKLNVVKTVHALAAATNIADCERNQDYGGFYKQSLANLVDIIATSD